MRRITPLVALLAASTACISQQTYEDRVDCLDEDADGATKGECRGWGLAGAPRDCADDRAQEAPGAVEVPYDGFDNDCVDGDVVDVDGDGIPGIAYAEWSALASPHPWPAGVSQTEVDCDDTRADVHPGASETWYDGLDADCAEDDDFDADGDGFVPAGRGYTGGLPVGDCDDTRADVSPVGDDVPYDGVDGDCDGSNDFDADGDGQMPAATDGLPVAPRFAQYLDRYGYDLPEAYGDCDDADPDVFTGAIDAAYDGLDADCALDDDYDADKDGFVPDLYAPFSPLPAGDCDDALGAVHPGALERLGDAHDGDCDGAPDGAPVDVGAFSWTSPRAPVLGATGEHLLLTTAADAFTDTTPLSNVGVTLTFPLDVGPGELPDAVVWQGKLGSYPLSAKVDALDEPGGFLAAAGIVQSGKTWLTVRRSTLEGGGWNSIKAGRDPASTVDPYLDVDVARGADGRIWAIGCGAETLHVLVLDDALAVQHAFDAPAGGHACRLSGASAEVWSGAGRTTWALDAAAGTATAVETDPTDRVSFASDGVLVGADGVAVVGEGASYEILGGREIVSAGGALGERLHLAAVTADGEVLLVWGDPEGELSTATLDVPFEAVHAAAFARDDRVLVAVTGVDRVGWAVLAPAP